MTAPDPGFPDLTPAGFTRSVDHGRIQTVHYPDGIVRIRHECHRTRDGLTLIAAPALQLDGGHTITRDTTITVTPSILCSDCGLHGFLTNGIWRDC